MGKNSNIEWTDFTWNPWHGCKKVSDGCKNCYMFRDKKRYGQDPTQVVRASDKTFYAPLKLKEPQRVFTCSWSDFFIEEADAWRDEAFAIMALTPHIQYQILTKRPERMLEYFDATRHEDVWREFQKLTDNRSARFCWPLPNVHLGVSVEDQKTADERIPHLLKTPAAARFLSVEPLLGPVNAQRVSTFRWRGAEQVNALTGNLEDCFGGFVDNTDKIDWVIVGGESGPNARPLHPDWVRSIRDQCVAAGVAFFFKQWGEFSYFDNPLEPKWPDGSAVPDEAKPVRIEKVGKKKSGRLLDGREWNEFPEVPNV